MHIDSTFARGKNPDAFAAIGQRIAAKTAHHDAAQTFDFAAWRELSDAGFWRIPITRKWGGNGGHWRDFVSAMDRLAATAENLGFLVSVMAHAGALRIIATEGSDDQKQRWLEPLMQGAIGVTAMTEASGGSDLSRMTLAATPVGAVRAMPAPSAENWRLNGRKVHITNAPIASFGMIAGRIPSLGPKKDITLFFVDLSQPGVRTGPLEDNLGMRGSPTADLIFDDMPLSSINIVGRPGDGLRLLHKIIAFERALYGITAAGLIEAMLATSLARTSVRQSFGRKLSDYQYVQGRLTDMRMAASIARLLTYSALDKLDGGDPDAAIECSICKLYAGEQLLTAAEHFVQLHGHLGFMSNAISRHYRDAIGMRIAGGTSDIQRINIFNQMQRLHAGGAQGHAWAPCGDPVTPPVPEPGN